MVERWLTTSEVDDVVYSIKHLSSCLEQVSVEQRAWKWAILSVHSALCGAMVCHLSGSAGIGALTEKSARAMLEWHEKARFGDPGACPREAVASPQDLFARVFGKSPFIEQYPQTKLDATTQQQQAFEQIHDLRNQFVYFSPKGWIIECSGLPQSVLSLLNLIEVIDGAGWAFRHLDDKRTELLEAIKICTQRCTALARDK